MVWRWWLRRLFGLCLPSLAGLLVKLNNIDKNSNVPKVEACLEKSSREPKQNLIKQEVTRSDFCCWVFPEVSIVLLHCSNYLDRQHMCVLPAPNTSKENL